MTNPTAEQACKKELRKNAGRCDIGPLVLKHHLESTEWTIEAIQRGDHREQSHD